MKHIGTLIAILLFFAGCTHLQPTSTHFKSADAYSHANNFGSGKLVIVQGPTSEHETSINILSPRLKTYSYRIKDSNGKATSAEIYETIYTEPLHWKVDKIFIKNLEPNQTYVLEVVDTFRGSETIVDTRNFTSLDIAKKSVRFGYASCMADDYRFNEVINPMWAQLEKQNPDLVILNGDLVYVDSFEFVERKKATELDIWFRFIDSLNRLPIYHWKNLKPILATWDDHDFGTNDSNRDFKSKEAARKIFLAFFGGKDLAGIYKLEKKSVYFSFKAFGQKMLFMDDRYFRQPNRDQQIAEEFGHWGEEQHQWLFSQLNDQTPAWIFNGNQFFSGNDLDFKESFQQNHPKHFSRFLSDLKKSTPAVAFASGDIHFSEIMKISKEKIGFESFEFTSSAMHSFTGGGWANPLRLEGAYTEEFNFMLIESKVDEKNSLNVHTEAWGLQNKPYFTKDVVIKR